VERKSVTVVGGGDADEDAVCESGDFFAGAGGIFPREPVAGGELFGGFIERAAEEDDGLHGLAEGDAAALN
jgi:hypothetical protein